MKKVTSEFSENCPVRYTIKGKPLITTDKWRISYAGSNLGGDAMILNIVDDKTIEIIPTKNTSNKCTVNAGIEFYDMPLAKDTVNLSFDWEGSYVAPIMPIIKVENISSVDNGLYVYRAVIENASEYTYPVSYEWSIDKTFGFETGAQASAESNDDEFRVTYSDISDADGEAGTTFTITLKIRAKYNPAKILEERKFKVHTTRETPVITSDSNPIIMNYCYEAGWCAVSSKMYIDECAAVTEITSTSFNKNNNIDEYVPQSFDEFRYFINVRSIPTDAFHYNSNKFKSIILPPNLTKIGTNAFMGCFGLTEITIPKTVTSIGTGAFYLNDNLRTINILGNVTELGSGAFYGCASLSELDLSRTSITTLPDNCIYNINYFIGLHTTTVKLPASLTYIGKNALVNLNIKDIYIHAPTAPDTDPNAFVSEDNNYAIGSAHDSNGHDLYIPSTSTGYDDIDSAWSYIVNDNWKINMTL